MALTHSTKSRPRRRAPAAAATTPPRRPSPSTRSKSTRRSRFVLSFAPARHVVLRCHAWRAFFLSPTLDAVLKRHGLHQQRAEPRRPKSRVARQSETERVGGG